MHRHPHLYEINAFPFLYRLGEKYGRKLTLSTIPEEEWRLLAQRGFDLVWLMGVWQRSPRARQEALTNPFLRQEYHRVLPHWREEDVSGSPYAIYDYKLDPFLGESTELVAVKSSLNRQGLGLLLDFVPNHLAFDHPWTLAHPDYFVQGKGEDVRNHPDWFFPSSSGLYLAHGRDPNFTPWSDTVQVNFYSTNLRHSLINELRRIAEVADGVRCDMAMLALNPIFEQVWGEIIKECPRLETEFWVEAIRRVKERHPNFLFLAEVYWGLEGKLQEIGFDFTYDKVFYDRLRFSTPGDLRAHLMADVYYQQRLVRFTENHDELRVVTAFGRQRALASAVILVTVPGLRLFHDGQLEGRQIRLPVQLARQPEEAIDTEVLSFYERLLKVSQSPAYHEGEWRLLETSPAREHDTTYTNLLAWCWHYGEQLKIVVVNYSPLPAVGWLKLPFPLTKAAFRDELTERTYFPDKMSAQGVLVELAPFQFYLWDTAVS